MKKSIHVVGAVITEDDKILCTQRGPDKSLPFLWEFPGGKIEEGESPEQALAREISEELKCTITVGEKVDHTVHEYDFGIVHLTTFWCELIEGSPVLTEHSSMKWLSADKLDALDWAPADIPAVKKITYAFSKN